MSVIDIWDENSGLLTIIDGSHTSYWSLYDIGLRGDIGLEFCSRPPGTNLTLLCGDHMLELTTTFTSSMGGQCLLLPFRA